MKDSRIPPERHAGALQALREAVQEGIDSGEPVPFDLQGILTEAKANRHSLMAGDLYVDVQALFQDAVKTGTPPAIVAEVLLHGARDVLVSDDEFLQALAEFLPRRGKVSR